jgi:ribonucleoside-triphosphate reductase
MPKMRVPCEVYSRIVGYLRPIRNWNAGKQQEFEDRVEFVAEDALRASRVISRRGGASEGQR